MENDTIVVVAKTRKDTYGNLWVTPVGGGAEVKIGSKREQLFDLFEQGKAVMLHWEVYMNKPYVADAKAVEGELPEPKEIEVVQEHLPKTPTAPQEIGMWWKELGNRIGDGSLEKDFPKSSVKIKAQYYNKMSDVTGVALKKEE